MSVKTMKVSVCILFACALSGCAALFTPEVEVALLKLERGQYALDKTHASLLFKVSHMGLSTFVGRFNEMDASLDFNPEKPLESQLQAVVNMATVDVNNTALSDMLRGGSWFNTEAYPQATFTTVSVIQTSEHTFTFKGMLTFLGNTQSVNVDVTFHGGANVLLTGKYTLGFSATTTFKRSDFGMTTYIPAVGDEITLEAHAEFQKTN